MSKPVYRVSDLVLAEQLQKMPRDFKFRIKGVEGLYYLYSESICADLHLYFRICKRQVFS